MPDLVSRLRRAGCVFAEDEAAILRDAASSPAHLEELVVRRISGEPLEHVVGWVSFGDLRLTVGPGVFVPRQRTLLLAGEAIREADAVPAPVVVEAYCGVAPVAASVARAVPRADVHATDRDEAALAFAARNLERRRVFGGDGLAALPSAMRGRIDVIAAVPPYVPDGASGLLPREALDHEPASALFGGADGLDPARRLIAEAGDWLGALGVLLIELNRGQARALVDDVDAGWVAGIVLGDDGQTAIVRLQRVTIEP